MGVVNILHRELHVHVMGDVNILHSGLAMICNLFM